MSKFSKLIQQQKEAKQEKKSHFNLEAKTNANRTGLICSCGSNKSYKSCCGIIHADIYTALTPLDLMKSRYTAYVRANIDFLMSSHHSSTRPSKEANEIAAWAKSVTWSGLEIVAFTPPTAELGYVTFKAHFIEDGEKNIIYEKSRFIKENNHWVYIDGIHS